MYISECSFSANCNDTRESQLFRHLRQLGLQSTGKRKKKISIPTKQFRFSDCFGTVSDWSRQNSIISPRIKITLKFSSFILTELFPSTASIHQFGHLVKHFDNQITRGFSNKVLFFHRDIFLLYSKYCYILLSK